LFIELQPLISNGMFFEAFMRALNPMKQYFKQFMIFQIKTL
jgi:hypothetical protein